HAAGAAGGVHDVVFRQGLVRRAGLLPGHGRRRLDLPHRRAILGPRVRLRGVLAARKGKMSAFRYFWEDFAAGGVFECGSRTLWQEEIIAFAREWDAQRFHVDPAAAKET